MPTTQAAKRDQNVVKVGSKDMINCTNLMPVIHLKPLQARCSPIHYTSKKNLIYCQQNLKISPIKKKQVNNKEHKELEQLLGLLKVCPKEELNKSLEGITFQQGSDNNSNGGEPSITNISRKSSQWPLQRKNSTDECSHLTTEASCLEQFSLTYEKERCFSSSPQHKYFFSIFTALVKERLSNLEWSLVAPPESILRVLICLRILLRDPVYQKEFVQLGAIKVLAQHLQKATESYITHGDGPYVVDILKEMTNIFQKLASVEEQRTCLILCEIHHSLVYLISATDVVVLHCALHALIRLAQSSETRSKIAELNSIEMLLTILQNYDIMSRKLAANLLLVLCVDTAAREYVKVYDGIPILLSLLRSDSARLLYYVIYCLVHLCKDEECSSDVRNMGGIPLLLSLLKDDRTFVSERSIANTGSSSSKTPTAEEDGVPSFESYKRFNSAEEISSLSKVEEIRQDKLLLQCACCTCITELVVSDTNAQQIVQSNGIYYLSELILPRNTTSSSNSSSSSSSTCSKKKKVPTATLR